MNHQQHSNGTASIIIIIVINTITFCLLGIFYALDGVFSSNAAHSLPKTVTFFPRTSIVILLQCQLSHFSFVKRTKWMSMILATKFNATSKREFFFLSVFCSFWLRVLFVVGFLFDKWIYDKKKQWFCLRIRSIVRSLHHAYVLKTQYIPILAYRCKNQDYNFAKKIRFMSSWPGQKQIEFIFAYLWLRLIWKICDTFYIFFIIMQIQFQETLA